MKGVLGIKKDKSGYVYYFNGREIYPRYINKVRLDGADFIPWVKEIHLEIGDNITYSKRIVKTEALMITIRKMNINLSEHAQSNDMLASIDAEIHEDLPEYFIKINDNANIIKGVNRLLIPVDGYDGSLYTVLHFYKFPDNKPRTAGHFLIIPKTQLSALLDYRAGDQVVARWDGKKWVDALRQKVIVNYYSEIPGCFNTGFSIGRAK